MWCESDQGGDRYVEHIIPLRRSFGLGGLCGSEYRSRYAPAEKSAAGRSQLDQGIQFSRFHLGLIMATCNVGHSPRVLNAVAYANTPSSSLVIRKQDGESASAIALTLANEPSFRDSYEATLSFGAVTASPTAEPTVILMHEAQSATLIVPSHGKPRALLMASQK